MLHPQCARPRTRSRAPKLANAAPASRFILLKGLEFYIIGNYDPKENNCNSNPNPLTHAAPSFRKLLATHCTQSSALVLMTYLCACVRGQEGSQNRKAAWKNHLPCDVVHKSSTKWRPEARTHHYTQRPGRACWIAVCLPLCLCPINTKKTRICKASSAARRCQVCAPQSPHGKATPTWIDCRVCAPCCWRNAFLPLLRSCRLLGPLLDS